MPDEVKYKEVKFNPVELPSAWETLEKLESELTGAKSYSLVLREFSLVSMICFMLTGKWLLK